MTIKQGDAYDIAIMLENEDGTAITPENVSVVEIALGSLIKSFPEGDVTFSEGAFLFPLSQEETFPMRGTKRLEVRVKFLSGDVAGAKLGSIAIDSSISREVL